MTIKALRYRPRLKEIRRLARSEAFGVSPGAVARASTGLVDGTRFDPEHENPVPDRAWLLVSARAALREAYRAHMKGDGRKHNKSIENFGHHLAAAQLERHLAGRRKPRQAHMPALDSWIGEALNRHPDATWKELWQRLAMENTDHDAVWIEGDNVTEWNGTKERSCKERSFRKRITAAKKNRK